MQSTREQEVWFQKGVKRIIETLNPSSNLFSFTSLIHSAERGWEVECSVRYTADFRDVPIFTHVENPDQFPSDHLMTKLILLVG